MENNGIKYIRIRDCKLPQTDNDNYVVEEDFDETIEKCVNYLNRFSSDKIDISKINFDKMHNYIERKWRALYSIDDPEYENEPIINYLKLNPDILNDDRVYNDFITLIRRFWGKIKKPLFYNVCNDELIIKFYTDENVRKQNGHLINTSIELYSIDSSVLDKILDHLMSVQVFRLWFGSTIDKFVTYEDNNNVFDLEKNKLCLKYIEIFVKNDPNYYRMDYIIELKNRILKKIKKS